MEYVSKYLFWLLVKTFMCVAIKVFFSRILILFLDIPPVCCCAAHYNVISVG